MSQLSWTRQTLPTGLTVLRYHRPSALTAQISIALRYGSNLDLETNSGTAHLLEHLTAGGSKRRIELSREIEHLGGCLDYFTTHDYTMAKTDVPSERIDSASRVLRQIMFSPSQFQQRNFERERKIILHEIAEISDDPWSKVGELLTKCLFKTHPVRLPVSGTRKTVMSLSQQEAEKTHQIQYKPENAILILTGQISEKATKRVLQLFDPEDNRASKTEAIFVEHGKPTKRLVRRKSGISQSYISMGAITVNGAHPNIPALELINAILGGGASSRLFIELREKKALAYNIQSFQECGLDYGFFHIDFSTKPNQITRVVSIVGKELGKIRDGQVNGEELKKVKDMILGAVYREIDNPSNLPETLASMEMLFKRETAINEYIEKLKTVTTSDITEVANRYLQPESLSIASINPKG